MHDAFVQRPMARADFPALLAILAVPEISQHFLDVRLGPDEIQDLMGDHLTSSLDEAASQRGECWIAAPAGHAGEAVAYAELIDGWLSFFVHPSYRRRHLACALIATLCRRAGQVRPQDAVGACVIRENIASVRLLEKAGFRFTGLEWHQTNTPLQLPMLHFALSTAAACRLTPTEEYHDR